MSKRASFFARTHPGIRRVRYPDEIVFEESMKEADGEVIISMLRRASLNIDINRINMAGMTALHQVICSMRNWSDMENKSYKTAIYMEQHELQRKPIIVARRSYRSEKEKP